MRLKQNFWYYLSIGFKTLFITLLLLGSNSISLLAQYGDATLRVVVISEEDGNPVIGANVILNDNDGNMQKAGATNPDGFIEFVNIDAREYQFVVSSIGFTRYEQDISLEDEETRLLRIELETATNELGEVVVGAQARRGAVRREAGKQTISVTDIELIPAPGPGGDLSVYLQTLPGVVTSGDRGGELFIRGGTPAQNLILVDKMPVIKPFHISNLFSAFPQSVISSVDFYAGGFGAEYTNATSSVLDVNLRQGNMRQYQSEVAMSPYLVSVLAEGPLKKDSQSLLVMGRNSVIEETGPSLTGQDVPLKFSDLLARYSINWPGFTCNITGMYTYDRGQINPQRSVSLTWENSAVGGRCLGYSEELNNSIDFTIGYSTYNSSELGIDNIGRQSGINMGYIRMDNAGQLFGYPVGYGLQWNISLFTAQLDAPFDGINEGRYVGLDSDLNEFSSIFNMYINTEFNPAPGISIEPGIASQIRQDDLFTTFEPRLRVAWSPGNSENTEISFSTGKYYQMREAITDERDAGTVFYVYKPVLVDEPVPESIHGILGFRQRIANMFEFNIEGYVKQHKNIPVAEWTREPGNTLRSASAEGFTYGADVQLEMNLDNLYMTVGYGLAEVTYEASAEDLVAWVDQDIFRYNPAHDRRHQFNALASYELGKFTFNAIWKYSAGAPYTKIYAIDLILRVPDENPIDDQGRAVTLYSEPYDGKLPSFQRLDVSIERPFQITNGFEIEAEIGAINSYNMRNVFYFDVNTLSQVDELPFLPYVSLNFKIN